MEWKEFWKEASIKKERLIQGRVRAKERWRRWNEDTEEHQDGWEDFPSTPWKVRFGARLKFSSRKDRYKRAENKVRRRKARVHEGQYEVVNGDTEEELSNTYLQWRLGFRKRPLVKGRTQPSFAVSALSCTKVIRKKHREIGE